MENLTLNLVCYYLCLDLESRGTIWTQFLKFQPAQGAMKGNQLDNGGINFPNTNSIQKFAEAYCQNFKIQKLHDLLPKIESSNW